MSRNFCLRLLPSMLLTSSLMPQGLSAESAMQAHVLSKPGMMRGNKGIGESLEEKGI